LTTAASNKQLGKYRVLRVLGNGASGTVYLCEHPQHSAGVAIKVLSSSLREIDATALKRFQREARAAVTLNHPNIVRFYDLDEHAGNPFLVMEYVDGFTVDEIAQKVGAFPIDQAVSYISQAACGMDYIHRCGMVHRDLKPTNLIVDRAGTCKVLDLGLVAFTDERRDRLTEQVPRILGTLDFMAPEQAERSSGVDIRADIYSLGATLYFMLTGQVPLPGGTVASKLIAMQFHTPRPIRQFRQDVDGALEQVIMKMLSKTPANRYDDPLEVVQALYPWAGQQLIPPNVAGETHAGSETPKPAAPPSRESHETIRVQPRMVMPPPAPRMANGLPPNLLNVRPRELSDTNPVADAGSVKQLELGANESGTRPISRRTFEPRRNAGGYNLLACVVAGIVGAILTIAVLEISSKRGAEPARTSEPERGE